MYKILNVNQKELFEGCLLAAIAHAIMTTEYPELVNEHSWDGINYNFQDSQGGRGTISFSENMFVAVFQSNKYIKLDNYTYEKTIDFFKGANDEILKFAKEEALQYVLEKIEKNTIPVISMAVWGDKGNIYSNYEYETVIEQGAYMIENQMKVLEAAILAWKGYYDMSDEQINLTKKIYYKKVKKLNEEIFLSQEEKNLLNVMSEGQLDECIECLSELNITY